MVIIINIKTYGKLYIVGEYSVLSHKGAAIVYGVNKYMNFTIKDSNNFSYTTRNITYDFIFEEDNIVVKNDFILLNHAITQAFLYLKNKNIDIKYFNLNINSELEESKDSKYGFGSSSALITGVIKSILLFHDLEVDNITLYKLAVITKYKTNNISSGGDIAASIYGGFIYYRRYNIKWLLKHIDDPNILEKKWKNLKIKPFNSNMNFNAIWTKTSYSYKDLTYNLKKKDYKITKKIINSTYNNLLTNNYLKLKDDLIQYQLFLEKILETDELYTKELRESINIAKSFNLASKISGAGGGDSAIFLYPKNFYFKNFEKELESKNLKLIYLEGGQNEY